MARSDTDSWDLASSVGATATMVAAARAIASAEPDPLINDPYAADLVRAVGVEFFSKLVDGEISLDGELADGAALMTGIMAVRTKFFDDFFTSAGDAGIRQAVILASGLDSRAYRLPWPDGTVVYEIDQPAVVSSKTATMAQIGATPTAERRTVAIDLRDDWPAALQAAGFDPTAPSAWSAEGLLAYLPPDAQDRLFDNIAELSAPGSRLATEFHPDIAANLRERGNEMSEQWRKHGLDLDLANLWYDGERNSVTEYLGGSGWSVTARRRPELFAEYGREFPAGDAAAPQRNSQAVIAIRD
ncbi:class I SAM-dependent methyltransferase [Mycolicibacterium fortuitum]|uniref:S-adenosyl-L-methionine-dependent methyltransferase n=1 Tax=Mycolicibacterium fortuitum subsp. fortuitum DSM 46621 = ATCC 6841 = JCM 6387 TaxID=1214102 RepID=K0V536_MYCFO|nr:class I SAM-dependent methyltransferase [Mycolicibacterium fortuitum]AIY45424.1 O-Methyltransferase involved in polyketide biosynthesis [Mycobacterium sp. VKM Ac-1817D]CRL75588.1 methyltransferase [Mycolicibacter nonchromogenicus]AMD54244.1 SAM-dependent methyltransferase [Mycolicibacterium fortuitum subsp. fortuitum DSM 46621 = ATCC 6841 = JCM 6387]EJZ14372.1 methyltransferase [Mycolicibacterium fortuitum subsp. fortuitum DSM 46621 = ATCC 6841 = JCM 6387]WEV34216.1 class I SAM-dependent me